MYRYLILFFRLISTAFAVGPTFAADKPTGPLGALPSPAGPHVAQLDALASNAWLDLGSPAPDPKWGKARGRSWTPRMAYAPDLRGAFLCATGVHGYVKPDGHYMDDLWLYDISGHRWHCLYPGANSKTLKLKLDKHGFEVNEEGDAIPVSYLSHGYNNLTYNPDLRKLMIIHTQCPWWSNALPQRWDWLGIPKDKQTYGNVGPVIASAKHPWFYDVASGKWERVFIAEAGPARGRFEGVLEYMPAQKKAHYAYQAGEVWIYDFAARTWTLSANKSKAPVYDCLACFDSKRQRIYAGSGNQFWVYDIASQLWSDSAAAHTPKSFGSGVHSNFTYDAANDVVILNRYAPTVPKNTADLGIHVYDPVKNTWEEKHRPHPENLRWRQTSAFYDQALNVHFYFTAPDSGDAGTMYVYRYRKPAR